jgi:NADPH:quinone reductase-like Zn-dependent oxidoreductase
VRFAEIALLVLPFAVFVAWRLLAPAAGPPRVLVIGVSGAVVAMAVLLLVLWYAEAEAPATRYVPAQLLENGRIVPPREEPVPR